MPSLEILADACSGLLTGSDDFWLIATLGDWSYEEGIRAKGYAGYLASWEPFNLPRGLVSALKIGINGNLEHRLESDQRVRLPVRRNPSRGTDIVFETTDGAGHALVEVKLVYDCTLNKYYDEVLKDRHKLLEAGVKNDQRFQVVFFTQLPNYSYQRGYWYGSSTCSRGRATNVVGIERQFAAISGILGSSTWPSDGPLTHELDCSRTCVTENALRQRLGSVFRPLSSWEFGLAVATCDAKVGVAIWQW